MNAFWKFSQRLTLVLVLSFQFSLLAATNEVAKFSGTVVDAQGSPVTGAAVTGYQYPTRPNTGSFNLEAKQSVMTDSHGGFELSKFDGQGVILVTKTGMAPAWRTLYSAQPEALKIVLGASGSLAGTVVDDAGRPVADTEVSVSAALNKAGNDLGQPNFLFGKIARELFSARTSADGKFRIENFPADAQASLAVKKAGKSLRQSTSPIRYDELPFRAAQKDIILTLDPAGSVTGKIVARETGQPMASAMINLVPQSPMGIYSSSEMGTIFSAADGSFQISGVSAGSYRLIATFTNEPVADWVADPVPVTIAAGQTVPNQQIQAYKGGVLVMTVRGKKNHELLADVVVSVNSQDFNLASSTGKNGLAFSRTPPGQFNVFVNKPGWSTAQAQATVTEGQTNQVSIELAEPFKISGVVRNSSGEPVAGASVSVMPDYQNGAGAKTDANGHYSLDWQKPAWAGMQNQNFYLVVRQENLKLAALQGVDETTTSLDVVLKPAMSISGQVLDAGGKPITNVVAYISFHEENSSFTIGRRPILADGQGRIQAEALPLGERYGWFISASGYGSSRQEMDAADPKADHYDFPPLHLKAADRKLAGRVLDVNGKPAAGAQIWMNGEGQPNGNATTDADGRFTFGSVCAGPVSLSANAHGSNASIETTGGETNLVLRLGARNNNVMQAASVTLTGNVFDPAGNHAVGALVVVTPSWGPINTTKTDSDGNYSIAWQSQPGMRQVRYFVVARDAGRNLAAIEAIDTNSTHVSLRLQPGLSISGTVQDAQGAPLSRANINLNIMAGNMGGMVVYEPVKVDADGAFSIPALPMGQQYNLHVTAKGYGSAIKSISLAQSQTNSVQFSTFRLRTADRPLVGKVLDGDDKPVPGAQVNINGNGQPNGNVRTDEGGNFKFMVCDGPIQIYAWSQSGSGINNSGSVQARGGDENVTLKLGVRQRPTPIVVMKTTPLKPQYWTISALMAWPADHKTTARTLLAVQAAILLGTSGGVFWFIRRRG